MLLAAVLNGCGDAHVPGAKPTAIPTVSCPLGSNERSVYGAYSTDCIHAIADWAFKLPDISDRFNSPRYRIDSPDHSPSFIEALYLPLDPQHDPPLGVAIDRPGVRPGTVHADLTRELEGHALQYTTGEDGSRFVYWEDDGVSYLIAARPPSVVADIDDYLADLVATFLHAAAS